MIHNQHFNIYIAGCTENGGIYQYRLDADGELTFVNHTIMDKPMYMTVDNCKMYIVLRAPFKHNKDSGVVVYDIDKNGMLINPSEIQSTKGEVACHITVDNSDVYCANYISGSLIKLPHTLVKHTGHSVHPIRQASPHAHYVGLTPDEKYLCAIDLGIDKIIVYDKNLDLISEVSLKSGNGPRHLAFSDDGKYAYCANELSSTVTVFSYVDGRFHYKNEFSTIPNNFNSINAPAAIRFNDGYVYVSNRGHNSIARYKVIEDSLELIDIFDCKGCSPRDFDIRNNYLICTNEDTDNVVFFKIHNEKPVKVNEIEIPKPLCICIQGD